MNYDFQFAVKISSYLKRKIFDGWTKRTSELTEEAKNLFFWFKSAHSMVYERIHTQCMIDVGSQKTCKLFLCKGKNFRLYVLHMTIDVCRKPFSKYHEILMHFWAFYHQKLRKWAAGSRRVRVSVFCVGKLHMPLEGRPSSRIKEHGFSQTLSRGTQLKQRQWKCIQALYASFSANQTHVTLRMIKEINWRGEAVALKINEKKRNWWPIGKKRQQSWMRDQVIIWSNGFYFKFGTIERNSKTNFKVLSEI